MDFDNIIISFYPNESGTYIKQQGFETATENSCVTCSILYDFKPEPLCLKADFKKGDRVDVILMEHRIELWVNNELKDEEWPAGNRIFSIDDIPETNVEISINKYIPQEKSEATVTGSIKNAMGWYPGNGVFVGDCMPYTDERRYHILYLKDRHHHMSKWGLGAHQWSHISTKDFVSWDIHPMAIEITDKREGSICTGSHIKNNDIHYLFYTVRMSDGSPAPICRSVSNDGYHFEKDTGFQISISSRYDGVTARDPKVICDAEGLFHMFLTTRLIEENRGCLAHLVSDDLNNWQELENPIFISEDDTEPECPDYIEFNGFYYLIYSLHGKAYYLYSDKPFSGWKKPVNPSVPCSSVPKGAVWNGKIVFTGFKRIDGYAGSLTWKSALNSPDGQLTFE